MVGKVFKFAYTHTHCQCWQEMMKPLLLKWEFCSLIQLEVNDSICMGGEENRISNRSLCGFGERLKLEYRRLIYNIAEL